MENITKNKDTDVGKEGGSYLQSPYVACLSLKAPLNEKLALV